MTTTDSDPEDTALSMFEEPASFRPPSPKPTQAVYTLQRGSPTLNLNLVGSSPLWGHILWHTSTTLARYLEAQPLLVKDKSVLELGAGAGLPGLVSAILGAKMVCITDYPDANLVQNLERNVSECQKFWRPEIDVVAEGFLWGSTPGSKLQKILQAENGGFDLLILSDLLFNHSEHVKLLASVKSYLKRKSPIETDQSSSELAQCPQALVFFTPHRPWLYEKDLAFFELARQEDFIVKQIFKEVLDKPMFKEDRGDEMMRRTVEGWEITWA